MMTVIFLIFGLIVGSFLNVLVYRLKDAETLLGRSFCRHCRHQIRWYDNIPLLSFVLLRGSCRDCDERISWQYPLLEGLTAVSFALVGRYFFDLDAEGTWLETAWLLGVVSLFLSIAAYDLRHMEIPVILLWVSAVWTALFLLTVWYLGGFAESWWRTTLGTGLFGGVVVALFFFALVYASRETWMGWGDVWLGGVAGMIVGLPAVLFMLTLSFGLGAFSGIMMMFWGDKDMKSQIPFAPYLVLGTLITIFLPRLFPRALSWLLL
jgi:prepilin signal peptidase PulO-like enzyme (type II secretory pathway)